MEKKGDVPDSKIGRPKKADQSEVSTLRQELKRLEEENEILKKAAVFFAKELGWSTRLYVYIAKNTQWLDCVKYWRYRPVAITIGWIGQKALVIQKIEH